MAQSKFSLLNISPRNPPWLRVHVCVVFLLLFPVGTLQLMHTNPQGLMGIQKSFLRVQTWFDSSGKS